ncbi:MAG: DUF4252 domain-containing protein [Bacteroidaceae bacterium]|nr:DUF4252 domain-containing protein [Bacteroidaceae bacterium]
MKLKRYLLVLLFMACVGAISAQSQLYDKYSEMENVTTVYLSKAMLGFTPSVDGLNMTKVAKKLDAIVILTTEKKETAQLLKADLVKLLSTGVYKALMKVKDEGDHVSFMIKEKDNKVQELLMLVEEKEEMTVIQMIGDINLEDVQSIMQDGK